MSSPTQRWKSRNLLQRTPRCEGCCKLDCLDRFDVSESGWRKHKLTSRRDGCVILRKPMSERSSKALTSFSEKHAFHCLERPARDRLRAQRLRQRHRARQHYRQRKHYIITHKREFVKSVSDLRINSAVSQTIYRMREENGKYGCLFDIQELYHALPLLARRGRREEAKV